MFRSLFDEMDEEGNPASTAAGCNSKAGRREAHGACYQDTLKILAETLVCSESRHTRT